MIKHIILLLVTSVFISGCVTNKGHRKEFGEICEYKQRDDCPKSGFTQQKTKNSEYHLGFIEFDDQGFLQGRDKKDAVMGQIRERVKVASETGKPVLVLNFIHGWHHDADGIDEDRDVYRFREKLLTVAANAYPDHEVIGIYLGWRGRVFKLDILDFFTFWNRKSTAHEVGHNGMTPILLEIEDAVKGYPVREKNNKMVTIGHSFGGAALYSALKGVLADRFVQSRPIGTTNKVDGFGDLVLLMNPAFESLQYQNLFELSQYNCLPYAEDQLPKFMILASDQDWAVSIAFPIGRAPYTLLENHEEKSAKRCRNPHYKDDDFLVSQWKGDMIGIGHDAAYASHQLQKRTVPLVKKSISNSQKSWLNYQSSPIKSLDGGDNIIPVTDKVELLSLDKTLANNPYMSVFVVDDLIPGHNEIWEDEIIGFVSEIIEVVGLTSD